MNTTQAIRLGVLFAACAPAGLAARADELPTCAGPAMGTIYRVALAQPIAGMTIGAVHREVDRVVARLDRALSTWREDSDASRFNRTAAGEWVAVSGDLVAVVTIARAVHDASGGAFDITATAGGSGRAGGMQDVEIRSEPPALRKAATGIALDLGGLGPGYGVDAIGARLSELGSAAHLVELGGEVRAWGRRADGAAWRVGVGGSDRVVDLANGAALATATARPGRSPFDPRSGRVVDTGRRSATVRAASCALADAWAVAALVLNLPADDDCLIRPPVIE